MGGIISRLLVSHADISKEALPMMSNHVQARMRKHPVIGERLKMEPIPNFDRVIFLAAPPVEQATPTAGLPSLRERLLDCPQAFLKTLTDTLTSYDDDLKDFVRTINNRLQNGPRFE
jgi:hypothetical protein